MIKRILPFIAALLVTVAAPAAERITLLITVTNVPVTGNTLTINSSIRTWTNAHTASTILTNLVSTNHATTNLFQQIAQYPYSGGIVQQWASSNAFRLIGAYGGALSGLQTGNWASLVLSTQSGPSTFTAIWPMENMVGETNRTNQGSSLVYGLGIYSTNALPANSTALSNVVNLYSNQTVAGNKTLTGTNTLTNSSFLAGNIVNALIVVTNARISNAVIHTMISTNGTNHGLSFSSPGAYPNSQQFGGGTVSSGGALVVGQGAVAGTNGVAIGPLSGAGHYSVAFGSGADASGATNSVAIGQNSSVALASNSVALGKDTQIGDRHHNSIVIGYAAASTTNDQVVLGASTHTVIVPGMVSITGTQTNTVFSGSNRFDGPISLTRSNMTTLANGVNLIEPGWRNYIKVSGPSAAYSIDKITGGWDGRRLLIQKNDAFTLTIANESGSGGGADTDRILTGTGANGTITNAPGFVELIYDSAAGRWGVISKSN